jgi:hypothetical protein
MQQIRPFVSVPMMLVPVEGGYKVLQKPLNDFGFNFDMFEVTGVLPLLDKDWHSEDLNKFQEQSPRLFPPYPSSDNELNMQSAINAVCRSLEQKIRFEPDTVMSLDEAVAVMRRFCAIISKEQEPIRQAFPAWQEFISGNPRYKSFYDELS